MEKSFGKYVLNEILCKSPSIKNMQNKFSQYVSFMFTIPYMAYISTLTTCKTCINFHKNKFMLRPFTFTLRVNQIRLTVLIRRVNKLGTNERMCDDSYHMHF